MTKYNGIKNQKISDNPTFHCLKANVFFALKLLNKIKSQKN